MKRKEQNRAAQRAFRERKEKHVKDLEDQLSAMATRNESTQAENDNLREMLRRLQAENTLLKQAAFTFSVPSGASINANERSKPPLPNANPSNGAGTQVSDSAPLATTSAPRNLQENSPPEDVNGAQSGQASYGSNSDWMPTNTGTAGVFPSPFTIISSNPTYMSYRDPAPSAAPFTSFMNSYSMPPRDGSVQTFSPQQQAYQNFLSPDVMMTDFNVGPSTLDSANYTFPSTSGDSVGMEELYPSMVNVPPTASYGLDSATTSRSSAAGETLERCPKEDIALEISKRGQSSFAPTEGVDLIRKSLSGHHFSSIAQSDSNIDAETAYQTIRNHPQFKDIDISSLCQEFAQKARCDGTKVVLPPNGVQELVDSLQARAAKV